MKEPIKASGNRPRYDLIRIVLALLALLGVMAGAAVGAYALYVRLLFGGWPGTETLAWKEEVQLDDGRVIVIERSKKFHGYGEPGQGRLEREEQLRIPNPDRPGEIVQWDDVGRQEPLILQVRNGVIYLVSSDLMDRRFECPNYNIHSYTLQIYDSAKPKPSWELSNFDRFLDQKWRTVSVKNFQDKTIQAPVANMLIGPKRNAEVIKKEGFITVRRKKERDQSLSFTYHGLVAEPNRLCRPKTLISNLVIDSRSK
ncbi:hypothetical protein [Chitinimonas koreensis]|uniref:hypothetical protein n=1 Tax=Chitinimonas koreensis TaxID=356302 RepID=UPI0012FC5C67|nr:hypothetical protein [Chitinimonas koreensis]QNM95688.1 hypothetical protein H9L41_17790 [Chitinimonas koreensis]